MQRAFCSILSSTALIGFSFIGASAQQPNALPPSHQTQTCRHEEFEAFAFLEGQWLILSSTRLASGNWEESPATSELRRSLSGCLLVEQYSGSREGHAFNAMGFMGVHPVNGKLRRSWMDSEHGVLVMYEGDKIGGEVVLETALTLQGNNVKLRHVYTEIKGDSFTLESRRSSDDGKTWTTVWRARYRRKSG